jgi:hypothetical protein
MRVTIVTRFATWRSRSSFSLVMQGYRMANFPVIPSEAA